MQRSIVLSSGVKRLEGNGARKGIPSYQTQNTLDLRWGSENMGAKFHARTGKQPRPLAKVSKYSLSGEGGVQPLTGRRLA